MIGLETERDVMETPKTDKAAFVSTFGGAVVVDADFARQLEQENESLRRLLDKASQALACFVDLRGMKQAKKPALIVLEAIINNRVFPKTCGECRFWAGYSCILKPTLRCKRDKVSRGCPLSVQVD